MRTPSPLTIFHPAFVSTLCRLLAISTLVLPAACTPRNRNAELQDGFLALDEQRYDQALAAADRYLRENPGGAQAAEATYLRGRAIEQRVKADNAEASSHLNQARAEYQKALALSPSPQLEGYIRTSLGNVCYWLNDYANAESYWAAAYNILEREDLKAWVLYRIGLCRQRLGRWADADKAFAMVAEQYPGTEAAERALVKKGTRQFVLQVAAFASAESANRLIASLTSQGIRAYRAEKPERKLFLVMAGPCSTYAEALTLKARLGPQYQDAIIQP